MLGPVIILVVLLVAIPVGVSMTGGIVAAILGWALRDDAAERHKDSELLEIS